MKCLLRRMLDETEFLSEYGVRSLSRVHKDHPFVLEENGNRFVIEYSPGDSTTTAFGGIRTGVARYGCLGIIC